MIAIATVIYYRPQTKFVKVMFSQVSVCLSLSGGLCPGGLCHRDPLYGNERGLMHPTGMHFRLSQQSAVWDLVNSLNPTHPFVTTKSHSGNCIM